MHALTFGLKTSQQFTSVDDLRRVWALADEGGFDGCWVFDHFAPMGRVRTGDIFEAWTIMAAMAQATRRVRVGSLVTGNVYRHPGVLAKMAVTVDHLSAGRLDMGLGAGGDPDVDPRLGLPLRPARERIERLDEACQALKLLWNEPTATFAGAHYRLDQAVADPKPVQRPHPPLWMGSNGERYGLRVVARHADVWMNGLFLRTTAADPAAEDADELSRLSRVLDRHCQDIGRDPAEIRRAVQFPLPADPDEAMRTTERYVRAGFSDVVLWPSYHADGVVSSAEAAVALLPKLRTLG